MHSFKLSSILGMGLLFVSLNLFSQVVTYDTPITQQDFDSYQTDISLDVGATGGSASAANGNSNYTIPIQLPPATNGFAPNISLVYNSGGGNGHLGYGWQISGLSAITRGPKSIMHDGEVSPVSLNVDDAFYFNGSRLINTNSNRYTKEVHDYSVIQAMEITENGPTWFQVEMKNGIILEYGKDHNSTFLSEDGSEILAWKINRMYSQEGNYIDFIYSNPSHRDHRITDIIFTGNTNTGLAPYNSINFNYLERGTHTITTYEAEQIVELRYVLANIEVTTEGGQLFKRYEMNYASDQINVFLKSITEFGTNGNKLNPTIFRYGNETTLLEYKTVGTHPTTSEQLYTGDFNADGYSDKLVANIEEIDGEFYHASYSIFTKDPDPSNENFDFQFEKILSEPGLLGEEINQYNFLSADFTGEGRDDVLYLFSDELNPSGTRVLTSMSLHEINAGGSSAYVQDLPLVPGMGTTFYSNRKPMTTGDFNGDGVMDILLVLANDYIVVNGWDTILDDYRAYVYYGNISTGFEEINLTGNYVIGIGDWDVENINAIDIDGDGKNEIMITTGAQSEIFSLTGNVGVSVNGAVLGYPSEWHLTFFGDFNGDKKTDLLTRVGLNDNDGLWEIGYSNGSSFLSEGNTFDWTSLPPDINEDYEGEMLLIGDYNGDGRSDIARGYNWNSEQTIYMFFNTGTNWVYDYKVVSENADNNSFGVQDFNGDGRSEVLRIQTGTYGLSKILNYNPEGEEFLLQGVKNGLGKETNMTYYRMTETAIYFRTEETEHPINTVKMPIHLLGTIQRENLPSEGYTYTNAKLHKEGRGIMGYEKIEKFYSNNISVETHNVFDPIQNMLIPEKTEEYHLGNLTKRATPTHQIIKREDAIDEIDYFIHNVTGNTEDNFFTGTNKTQLSFYDPFGNVEYFEESINGIESKTVDMVYGAFGGPVPNVATSIITNTNRSLSSFQTHVEKTYNAFGQVTSKTINPNEQKSTTTSYSYNDFGNLISSTINADGLTSRTNSQVFDNKGRYAIEKTNALGQTTFYSYDSQFGLLIAETGIDELSYFYEYDEWGRKKKTTFPLGFDVNESYSWGGAFSSYSHEISHPGRSNVTRSYDVHNRVTTVQESGFGFNQTKTSSTVYDDNGNVFYETSPSGFVTTYYYDNLLRPIKLETEFDETNLAYSYSSGNLTTTTTNSTGQTIEVKDATGKIISTTDEGGTLEYKYHANGEIEEIYYDGTLMGEIDYDAFGRQTKLVDINAGTSYYDYDAFGQLESEISPTNNITNFSYNELGMILSRNGVEGNTSYEYHVHGGDINKTKMVTDFEGNVENYIYDNFGRLLNLTHNVDGTNHIFEFEYDQYDNQINKKFPSGFELNYQYTSNGYLKKITDASGSQVIYENLAMNSLDQHVNYRSIIQGVTENTAISYNHSIPIQIINGTKNTLSYDWDFATGNLLGRTTAYGAMGTHIEIFNYDDLNRLLSQEIVGAGIINSGYAANGNILFKEDAGADYGYDTERVNAVNCINSPDYTQLSMYQQDIEYTTFYQPMSISENDHVLNYVYNSGQERIKSSLTRPDGSTDERLYLGDYEKFNGVDLHYINVGRGVHMVVERNGSTDTYYRSMTDYLGSVMYLGDTGGNEFHFNYDAWGRDRDVNDLSYLSDVPDKPDWFNRGYTGHEHLHEFQLINMNGRLYDPVIGRMLSPDNNIQATGYTQNYNRYSYAMNNPLKYNDPDGEFILEALVGIGVNAVINQIKGDPLLQGWAGAAFGGLMSASVISTIVGTASNHLPSFDINLGGGFGLSISPALAFGSGGVGLGANATLSYTDNNFSIGTSYGFTKFSKFSAMNTTDVDTPIHVSGWERRLGWGASWQTDNILFSWGTTKFYGLFPQTTGFVTFGTPTVNFTFDNDVHSFGLPLGDNGDRHRSAGVTLQIGDVELGLLMFTGDPGYSKRNIDTEAQYLDSKNGLYLTSEQGNPDSHRLGALFISMGGYRLGVNSEGIRHKIQNQLIHNSPFVGSPYFKVLNIPSNVYGGRYNRNPFTTW